MEAKEGEQLQVRRSGLDGPRQIGRAADFLNDCHLPRWFAGRSSGCNAAFKLVVLDVRPLTDNEHALLEKLASAGRPTELDGDDLILGQTLEPHGLVLFVRDSAAAVITPKGRHALTAIDISMKPVSPK